MMLEPAVRCRRLAGAALSYVVAVAALWTCAGLTAPAPARAAGGQTGNLTGTVVDAKTHAPIAGATVAAVAPTGTYHVTTDGRGFFSIVGIQVDTYLVSVQAPGYDAFSVSGVTVTGDQNLALGALALQKQLRTIGRVTARSPSSVYQPSQTIDSYTVSGERIVETTGKVASTNESDLVLSVPGVTLTNSNSITIRGGLQTEVGYQFDGIDFTEPFFSQNASNGRFNGLGSLQIVEGAGDATQGNVGGGVVNLIPKRGTDPPFGYIDFEAGAPNFFHQFAFEYGAATPNGRFSNYIAYNGQRDVPYSQTASGYPGALSAAYGNYYGTSYESNDDLVDNFVFKFGKNNAQSLQVLYLNRNLVQYGNLGGFVPSGPNQTLYYNTDPLNPLRQYLGQVIGPHAAAHYPDLVGINPNVPPNGVPNGPEESAYNPTRYLKFEYDNNLDSSTFLRLRYYNWETQQGTNSNIFNSSVQPLSLGLGTYPLHDNTGGPRVGTTLDLTKQFGASSTTTLSLKYEDAHPVWNDYDPDALVYVLSLNLSRMTNGPSYLDWLKGGYIYDYFHGNVPRIPIAGINYNQTWFQTFGVGLREQYSPTDRLHFDLGVRVDGQNQHYGPNPLNPTEPNNPYDVNPTAIGRFYLNPRETEPRAAVSYQIDKDDAVRGSYGRSVVFNNGQIGGTPSTLYNFAPYLNVPAKPSASTFPCGSGTNPTHQVVCTNYAQQLYWLYDQNFDAPDVGMSLPALYNNYDLSYSHQFRSGLAFKLTPFYKLGTNLPSFALVRTLVPGQTVFTVNNSGINRTSGVEIGLNTAEKPIGVSGFLSATYQNVLASTPPGISGEDALPINGSGSLDLGDVYRAGYVSPLSVRLGGDYKTKSGFRINPVIQYDRGYPYGVGNTIASNALINGVFLNLPQVNFGPGMTQIPGYQASSGTTSSTNYYDPAFPGSATHPNIAATRGTPETSSAGGVLYKPNLLANVTFEYTHARNTVGVQVQNLFGNAYNGAIPQLNPYYQPVATGLSGPQTGVNPFTASEPGRGFANVPHSAYAFTNGAYLLLPVQPTTLLLYYQREL